MEKITNEQYQAALLVISKYKEQMQTELSKVHAEESIAKSKVTLYQMTDPSFMETVGFSNRAMNAFRYNNIKNLNELVKISSIEFKRLRYAGKTTYFEVCDRLYEIGLRLGMPL